MSASQNGGIFYLTDSFIADNTTTTTSHLRNLVDHNNNVSSFSAYLTITNCSVANIKSENGGIFYNAYSNQDSLLITLQYNTFQNVTVFGRGGIIYTIDSSMNVIQNKFENISAWVTGVIIYSDGLKITSLQLSQTNEINFMNSSNINILVALAPNTLDIELLSTDFA